MKLRILSINILAPELFLYFWRSSYGLTTFTDNNMYDMVTIMRLNNIINYIDMMRPNILCLQEVSDQVYSFLNNKTIQQYIAENTGLTIINESFKKSPFNYDYPPNEQNRNSGLKFDSGVATLVDQSVLPFKTNVNLKAEDFGNSPTIKTGVGIGSPMVINEFIFDGVPMYLVNLHIRMTSFPHIDDQLNEIYNRLSQIFNNSKFSYLIALGDFNSDKPEGRVDLQNSILNKILNNLDGENPSTDHIFVGDYYNSKNKNYQIDRNLEILEIDVNENLKLNNSDKNVGASNSNFWNDTLTNYNLSQKNINLINNGIITTDHAPLILDIEI